MELSYIEGMLPNSLSVVRPITDFFPEEIQELVNLDRYKLTDKKRITKFLIGVAKIISNITVLKHRKVRFDDDLTCFHDPTVFAPYVGNIIFAINRDFITKYLGRDKLSTTLREAFFHRFYKGTNLFDRGCSAFVMRPWLHSAANEWFFQHNNYKQFEQHLKLNCEMEIPKGDIVDAIRITPRELKNIKEGLRISYEQRNLASSLLYLSLQKQIESGFLFQAYVNSKTGRYQGVGKYSLQGMKRTNRHQLLKGWHDYDVSACAQTIMVQQYKQETGKSLPIFEQYLSNKDEMREQIAEAFEFTTKRAKKMMTSFLFGPTQTEEKIAADKMAMLTLTKLAGDSQRALVGLERVPFVKDMWKECKALSRHFSKQDHNLSIKNAVGVTKRLDRYSAGKSLAHKYFGFERQVLDVVRDFCIERDIQIILIHDGFITDKKIDVRVVQKRILDELGFKLEFEYARL